MKKISIEDIYQAQDRIQKVVSKTPLEISRHWSDKLGRKVFLKYENLQRTGSFKIRGALNKVMSLSEAQKQKGVVAASAGNHAQGVAFSASYLNIPSYIVMPVSAPIVKVLATQHYGAQIIQHGQFFDESYAYARELEKKKGYSFVHAFEDPFVIAGQGTIGLEILKDLEDVDAVVVPIGGGGLISGIATAIKSLKADCKVYGVVAENAPGMERLFHHKPFDPSRVKPSIADGIAVKKPSPEMYQTYIASLVDDITSVREEDVAEAMVYLLERAKTVVEGSGAVALAAATKAGWKLGKKTVFILSGGNVDLNLMASVIEKGLAKRGRIARFSVQVADKPGMLNWLTGIVAQKGANVLEVHHDRFHPQLSLGETAIDFLIETRDKEQLRDILKAIQESGAVIL